VGGVCGGGALCVCRAVLVARRSVSGPGGGPFVGPVARSWDRGGTFGTEVVGGVEMRVVPSAGCLVGAWSVRVVMVWWGRIGLVWTECPARAGCETEAARLGGRALHTVGFGCSVTGVLCGGQWGGGVPGKGVSGGVL